MALWGGRFDGERDPLFRAYNDSLPFDARLVQDDIVGSMAWARALGAAGVLTSDEVTTLVAGLERLATEAVADLDAVRHAGDEDVHSWVERRLIEDVGDVGRKLHTGRSRNDQVATDLRLWTRRALAERGQEIRAAQAALVALAARTIEVVIPGYTHLQRAQPVLFAHWCLAYVEMLERDHGRFADAARRADAMPLGCGALAGTAYDIDRDALAADLGFAAPCRNSLDAVSDRDFVVESVSAATLCAIHLSRLAEDLIFGASGEAGFVQLDDRFTSGSSLMPQKKNPDGLELIRGKCGRVVGALTGLCVTLKGLPLAYNKDMQEDKEPLFDAMDTLSMALRGLVVILDGVDIDAERSAAAAQAGYANATELADYLVGRGIPFRTAHDLSGQLVRLAIDRGVALEALPLDVMQSVCDRIEADVVEHLTLDALLAKRATTGGTAPATVRSALVAWQERLAGASSD